MPFTDGTDQAPTNIIYQASEDDADDTIVPRFISAEGDPERLLFISERERYLSFSDEWLIDHLDRLDDILVYQENNKKFLRDTFGIKKYPSKSTYSRVLSITNGKAVGNVILQIMRERLGNTGKIIIADGKAQQKRKNPVQRFRYSVRI